MKVRKQKQLFFQDYLLMNWNVYQQIKFSKFDRLLKVGKSHNCKLKAKAIRNSLNLVNKDNFEVEKIAKKITLMLTDRETNWDDQQKMKLKL